MTVSLKLTAQPGSYGIARCAAQSPVPEWAMMHAPTATSGAANEQTLGRDANVVNKAEPGLLHITQAEDETSITCLEARIPAEVEASRGWMMFRVDTLCDLDAPGVVLSAVQPVAEAGCGVFALSTYLRDYILIRAAERDRVLAAWVTEGHQIEEARSGTEAASAARPGAPILLRRAEAADCAALAALHLRLWRQTYAALAPPEIVERFDLAGRQNYWSARLSRRGAADAVFVVERGGELLGFSALQPQEHTGACGDLQIKHLFLDPALRGLGMGRRLLHMAQHQAQRLGCAGLSLNVVQDNAEAVDFYHACGGRIVGTYADPGPLWHSQNYLFRWVFT